MLKQVNRSKFINAVLGCKAWHLLIFQNSTAATAAAIAQHSLIVNLAVPPLQASLAPHESPEECFYSISPSKTPPLERHQS